jgi:class 3 adenylate cyclase
MQPPPGISSGGNLIDVPTPVTTREYLTSLVSTTAPEDLSSPPAPSALLFRGLRVRIGLHAGLTDPASIIRNPNNGHLQYGGTALATTMSVCGAGHGGMVLMSGATFSLVSAQTDIDAHF